MTEAISNIETSLPGSHSRIKVFMLRLANLNKVRTIAILVFLLTFSTGLMYKPFKRIVTGDPAIYDYMAQSILRGQLPYRDVNDVKWPGSPYLSALAMGVCKIIPVRDDLVGMRDVLAVRLLHVIMLGLFSVLIFLVAETYLRNRFASVIAAMISLLPVPILETMMGGTQPKLPMMLFGMLSLLFIARDRPFWAGFCSMLSCIFWQPGLMFTGVAFLIFSNYLTNWRDLRALKVLLGASIPLSIMLGYFCMKGGLEDFWAWTITFNYSMNATGGIKSFGKSFFHIWKVTARAFRPDVVLVWPSLIGMAIYSIERIRARAKNSKASIRSETFKDALLFPPILYFMFCMVDFQGVPDLIPLLPFISIFTGWFLVRIWQHIASSRFFNQKPLLVRSGSNAPGIAIVLILIPMIVRGATYDLPLGYTIRMQYKQIKGIAALLEPNDIIYVYGSLEIPILLNRQNPTSYVCLDAGQDKFAVSRKPEGFSIVGEIKALQPKLVAVSRLNKVSFRDEIKSWLRENYEESDLYLDDVLYARRQK